MRYSIFALAFMTTLCLSVTSCKKDGSDESATEYVLSAAEMAEISANFCGTTDEHDFNDYSILNEDGSSEDRGSGVKGKFWPVGQVLRVYFQNGSPALQDKVFNYAKTWANSANVSFVKVNSSNAEIRVRFGNIGHNSYIGTDNLLIAQSLQTMNFQLTDNSNETDVRRVALHEFGHALGLMHEHQNPSANISWDKPKVYAYYANTQGWSAAMVDAQVLNKHALATTQHTSLDPQSIMSYSIPASLTTNGFSIPWNTQLSVTDKAFIGKMYSNTRIRVRHAANIMGNVTVSLNGVTTTLVKNQTLFLPAKTTGNVLQIWECPSGCMWSSFNLNYGSNYKIVSASNNPNDLTLVLDPG